MDKQLAPVFEQLKVVLTDFDGTLVDNLSSLYEVYCTFLQQFRKIGTREEFATLNGPGLSEIVISLKDKYHLKPSTVELRQSYLSLLRKHYAEALELAPGARAFLEFVKGHGLKLGIVTSAPVELIDTFLIRQGLSREFDHIVSSLDVTQSKPHPEIYQKALKFFDVEPQEAIACEDAPHGIHAAMQAKIFTFMFVEGKGGSEGSCAVNNWNELLAIFQAAYAED